jgi:Domain of unknown function (DUF1877)
MSCLGVHFSFPAAQGGGLWDGDEAARAFVAELEERWDTYYLQETDKAWDAIHRCLSDGTLKWSAGDWPLCGAILGGEHMYLGSDFIICFIDDEDITEIAGALDEVTQPWFRERYFGLAARGYEGPVSEPDFDYTWHWFELMRAFFRKTADEGRHMVFTADQ